MSFKIEVRLRMAAYEIRESSVNDHLVGSLIFCPKIPFSELFSNIIFTNFSDSYFLLEICENLKRG